MYVNSFYNKMLQSTEKRTALGYDYAKEGLIKKFVSPRLYFNPRIEDFLNLLDPVLIEMVDMVKKVQFFNNYTIDKNDRRINS